MTGGESSSILHLVTRLRDLDIKLWIDGDRLRCSAPAGVLTPNIKAELGHRKTELLTYLKSTGETPVTTEFSNQTLKSDDQQLLSFSQQRLWFLDQMEPGNPNYNIRGFFWIEGALNVPALERAMIEIIQRHESLRTSFLDENGSPWPVVGRGDGWSMEVIDLTEFPLAVAKEKAIQLVMKEARRPFNLAKSPLFRAVLICIDEKCHGLFSSLHHIISDGLSAGVMAEEFCTLYQAFSLDKPSPLPALDVQYSDFARWQRGRWDRGEIREQLEYWKKQLGGKLPVLDLPADHVRPPILSFRGGHCKMIISSALTSDLRELCRREKITLFMMLLSAFKVFLYRHTGLEDVIVGTPVSGRVRLEYEALIGFFVNTLVMRTDLSGNPSFREVLARVREVILHAFANQEVPFDQLVEVLRPERSVSYPPLFQILFTLQPIPVRSREIGDVTFSPVEDLDSDTSRFDLAVDVVEKGEGLEVYFEYNSDLFEKATVLRFQEHFQKLLQSIVADPGRRVAALQLLSDKERRQVLVEWNRTQCDYPRDICIHHLFEDQVRKTPDRIALQFGDVQWTYLDLDKRANQLASHLRKLGVDSKALVGICLERSPLMVLAVLATMKAGGAYVPLDPVFPRERIAFMLDDARVSVLLTQEHLREAISLHGVQVICLEAAGEIEIDPSSEPPSTNIDSENLAYVIYTSGSTGKPKGVEITHRAVVNFLLSMMREPGLTHDDRLLSVTTLSFDIAGLELYLPLITGARIILASRAVAADAHRLAELIELSGATVMQATPATWRMLLEAGWQGNTGLKILCGGEALPRDLADQLLARSASLWNMYGPTETTIWSTLWRAKSGDGPVPIGRPIANTQVYVLDPHLEPVPIGVTGELFIGGDGVARGYFHRPELTQERFIPNPFSSDASARLYKTGDLARYRPDGTIECLGRIDHQVKIRGFRIELGEIEGCLGEHPDVRQAAVVAREDQKGSRRLVAYVVMRNGAAVGAGALRDFAKERLPDYMVPSSYVTMDALPLTPNGKVDRNALPDPTGKQSEEHAAFVAPRSELERTIAEVWREVLNVDRVGLEDNFFDLGGHSLLIVKVHSKLRALLNCELSLVDMFQRPTVAALSGFLNRQMQAMKAPN